MTRAGGVCSGGRSSTAFLMGIRSAAQATRESTPAPAGLASASVFFTGRPWTIVAHRELDDLAADRARDVGDLHDLRRHVARRRVGADLPRDALAQARRRATRPSRRRTNRTTRTSSLPVLADCHAFEHLGHLFDLAVDLGGADAHAAGVERRVGAAVDDQAVVLGQLARSRRGTRRRECAEKYAARYFSPSGSFQNADRHRRERRACRPARPSRRARAGRRRRRPRPSCRGRGIAARRDTPAAAGCRARSRRRCRCRRRSTPAARVVLHVAVDVVEAFRRQRRAGREDGLAGAAACGSARGLTPALSIAPIHFALVPNTLMPIVVGEIPQRIAVGMRRASRRTAPAWRRPRGRTPASSTSSSRRSCSRRSGRSRFRSRVQAMFLEVLQQRAAGAVHDAFRHAGGAGGIQDVERVVERAAPRRSSACSSVPTNSGQATALRRPSRSSGSPLYGITTKRSTLGNSSSTPRILSRQSKRLPP